MGEKNHAEEGLTLKLMISATHLISMSLRSEGAGSMSISASYARA